ncbi:MAG: ferrochelatase, partial [Actinomadura sp.]
EHYFQLGGRSPINDQNRALLAAIREDLVGSGIDLPVYWGNRNWTPYLTDTVRQMAADGVRKAAAFVTSAYSGYSCSDQYVEDIARARAATPGAPEIDKLPVYCLRPGFVEPFVASARAALDELPAGTHLVFTAHSVPLAQPGREAYVAELRQVAALVRERVAPDSPWDLVFQSRSGPPSQPWLEPDICDHLDAVKDAPGVVVVPIGFVSDHMEVKYDLDVVAAERAAELGLPYRRAATPGTHPLFVALARELLTT